MPHLSGPTALIEAPAPTVWRLLTWSAGWSEFFELYVFPLDPPGESVVGQRVYSESGPRFLPLVVTLEIVEIGDARARLRMLILLPCGVRVDEDLACIRVNENRWRVTYGCHFTFLRGCRGVLAQTVFRRELDRGPADSPARLKQFADVRKSSASGDV